MSEVEYANTKYYITLIDEDFKIEPFEADTKRWDIVAEIKEKYAWKSVKVAFLKEWWSITDSFIKNSKDSILYI